MTIFINPGSGPVMGATEANAAINITVFMDDLAALGHEVVRPAFRTDDLDSEGRFGWVLTVDDHAVEVEMPGIPVEQVRWMDESQNIWDYPRLYVDGSSWVWKFALDACSHEED